MKTLSATQWLTGALGFLVSSLPCLAGDDPQQELEKLRKAFEEYKATKEAEIDRVHRTLAEAKARWRNAETDKDHLKAMLAAAERANGELAETVKTLAKEATAVNEQNKALLARLSRAELAKKRFVTEQLVRGYLTNTVARYEREFRRLPPMSVKELNSISRRYEGLAIKRNSTNECNEVLFVALCHRDLSTPLGVNDLPTEIPFGNTDDDIWNQAPIGLGGDRAALEILDSWGNPIIYIHRNRYREAVRIINGKGKEIEVSAVIGPDGVFYNPTSFQIISVGPNGVQEATKQEGGDDIMNFRLTSK
jgi:hypothetical protein